MAERGITGEVAVVIFGKLAAFANFGFPESHSVSFAYLVYASAWCKLHHPAAFCASLLNAQPHGVLVAPHPGARRPPPPGGVVRGPDVDTSAEVSTLEPLEEGGGVAMRLGLDQVRDAGDDLAARPAEARPYTSMDDLVQRTEAGLAALEALAVTGAFACLGLDRREARPVTLGHGKSLFRSMDERLQLRLFARPVLRLRQRAAHLQTLRLRLGPRAPRFSFRRRPRGARR